MEEKKLVIKDAEETEEARGDENETEMNAEASADAMQKAADLLAKGKLQLVVPIRGGGEEVNELAYDFNHLTGIEYADALDSVNGDTNLFKINKRQAFALFAATAAKETKNAKGMRLFDERDITERMGTQDAMKAVQVAELFFIASTRAGNQRIISI